MINRQFWLAVLLLYGLLVPLLFGFWWFTRRSIRRLLTQQWRIYEPLISRQHLYRCNGHQQPWRHRGYLRRSPRLCLFRGDLVGVRRSRSSATRPLAINDDGVIVGFYSGSGIAVSAFVAYPVPEPGSSALPGIGLSLILIWGTARRLRHS